MAGIAYAQTVPAPATVTAPEPADQPLMARISGLFDVDLPQLDPPGTVQLILRPHFGDLIRRDYMRIETGLRWALNEQFEVSAAASTFFTHGLDDSVGYGIGKLRLGARYVFENFPYRDYETTLALNAESPVGHPPVDMTDGFHHFAPSFVVQHQLKRNPRLTAYSGMGVDIVGNSDIAGTPGKNQPLDDSISITAGGIYDRGQLKWTLSGTYATTAGITDGSEHFFYLQPGLLWYVPKRFTFKSKAQWIVGLSARTTFGPDGTDVNLTSRLRGEITFRQVMNRIRNRSDSESERIEPDNR